MSGNPQLVSVRRLASCGSWLQVSHFSCSDKNLEPWLQTLLSHCHLSLIWWQRWDARSGWWQVREPFRWDGQVPCRIWMPGISSKLSTQYFLLDSIIIVTSVVVDNLHNVNKARRHHTKFEKTLQDHLKFSQLNVSVTCWIATPYVGYMGRCKVGK